MIKRIRQFAICPTPVFAVLFLCAAVPAYSGTVLSVVPDFGGPVGPGQTVSYDIDISGATDVYSWALSLAYNPAILSFTGTAEGGFLATGGQTVFFGGTANNALGQLFAVGDSLVGQVPGVGGSGTLATLTFDITGLGTSSLNLFSIKLMDSQGNQITMAPPGQGSLNSVPEPATYILLGLGITGLGLVRRRR